MWLPDGRVLDESLDVMYWALHNNDPLGWLEYTSNEILLAVVVCSFGFVFPLAKLLTSFFEGLGSIPTTIQRFSMVDVFLLSFLVYGSKISGSYDVVLGAGFYFLCVALTLSFARTSFGKEAIDG